MNWIIIGCLIGGGIAIYSQIHKNQEQKKRHENWVSYPIEYEPPINISEIKETTKKINYEHQAYAKTIAFVGEMENQSLKSAMQKAVNVGGILSDTIDPDVDYVIWGQYSDEKSDELIDKAYELKLEVLNEDDFSDLLKNKY